jgi:hypothetical protein
MMLEEFDGVADGDDDDDDWGNTPTHINMGSFAGIAIPVGGGNTSPLMGPGFTRNFGEGPVGLDLLPKITTQAKQHAESDSAHTFVESKPFVSLEQKESTFDKAELRIFDREVPQFGEAIFEAGQRQSLRDIVLLHFKCCLTSRNALMAKCFSTGLQLLSSISPESESEVVEIIIACLELLRETKPVLAKKKEWAKQALVLLDLAGSQTDELRFFRFATLCQNDGLHHTAMEGFEKQVLSIVRRIEMRGALDGVGSTAELDKAVAQLMQIGVACANYRYEVVARTCFENALQLDPQARVALGSGYSPGGSGGGGGFNDSGGAKGQGAITGQASIAALQARPNQWNDDELDWGRPTRRPDLHQVSSTGSGGAGSGSGGAVGGNEAGDVNTNRTASIDFRGGSCHELVSVLGPNLLAEICFERRLCSEVWPQLRTLTKVDLTDAVQTEAEVLLLAAAVKDMPAVTSVKLWKHGHQLPVRNLSGRDNPGNGFLDLYFPSKCGYLQKESLHLRWWRRRYAGLAANTRTS